MVGVRTFSLRSGIQESGPRHPRENIFWALVYRFAEVICGRAARQLSWRRYFQFAINELITDTLASEFPGRRVEGVTTTAIGVLLRLLSSSK